VRGLILGLLLACGSCVALAQEQALEQAQAQALVPEFTGAVATATGSSTGVVARLETGIASWYGKQFHGRKTASGEKFNMDALTAAHPKLPFGSLVRVKNLLNGRSVDVRINDRGPYIKRRIIDLSRAAAQALGVSGTYQVELSVLDKPR
jgi:rare lipoprotein A